MCGAIDGLKVSFSRIAVNLYANEYEWRWRVSITLWSLCPGERPQHTLNRRLCWFQSRLDILTTAGTRTADGPVRILVAIPVKSSAISNWFFIPGLYDRRKWRTGGMIIGKGKQNNLPCATLFTKIPTWFTLGLNKDTALRSRQLITWKNSLNKPNTKSFSGKQLHIR